MKEPGTLYYPVLLQAETSFIKTKQPLVVPLAYSITKQLFNRGKRHFCRILRVGGPCFIGAK